MPRVLWMIGLFAACGGDDKARHIVDGQGSGSGATPDYVSVSLSAGDFTASAAFYATAPDTSLPAQCTSTVQGSCTFTLCSSTPTYGPYAYLSAGTISVIGGTPPTTYSMSPTATNTYTYGPTGTDTVFDDGDMLTVSGTGATIPAFSQSMTLPGIPTVTAPATSGSFPRSTDLTVSWSGADHLGTIFTEIYETAPYEVLSCTVPATDSTGSVAMPTALLQMMTAGPSFLVVDGFSTTTANVGDRPTTFAIGVNLLDVDGDDYYGRLTLQ
jgi:hypothetical protein